MKYSIPAIKNNFYWLHLSNDAKKLITETSIQFLQNATISNQNWDKYVEFPLKDYFASYVEHQAVQLLKSFDSDLLEKEYHFIIETDSSNWLWSTLEKQWGYYYEWELISIEDFLYAILLEGYTEIWLSRKECDMYQAAMTFDIELLESNTIYLLMLIHYFLDETIYVIKGTDDIDWVSFAVTHWLEERIKSWKVDTSMILKCDNVVDDKGYIIHYDDQLLCFEYGLKDFIEKANNKKLNANESLIKLIGEVEIALQKSKWNIQLWATISESWNITWTIKSSSNSPSSYAEMEKELWGFWKISKKKHWGRTTWIEIEKSIKIVPKDNEEEPNN